MGLLNIFQGSSEFVTRRQGFPNFSNKCRGCLSDLKLTPRIPEIFSTNARDFEPVLWILWGRLKYWLLSYPDTLVRSTGHLTNQNISCLFYDCTDHAPFSIKINVPGAFTLSVLVYWLNLRINPRKNYLNMTAFSKSHAPFDIRLQGCTLYARKNINQLQ